MTPGELQSSVAVKVLLAAPEYLPADRQWNRHLMIFMPFSNVAAFCFKPSSSKLQNAKFSRSDRWSSQKSDWFIGVGMEIDVPPVFEWWSRQPISDLDVTLGAQENPRCSSIGDNFH
jgi:hypothetical protein